MTTSSKTNKEMEKIKKEFEKIFSSNDDWDNELYQKFPTGWKSVNRYVWDWIETAISKAREEGAKEAYLMFLKEIKSAKNKFPNRNEFELVVDVRDIEKSIKFLTQDNEKEGSSGYDDFGNPIKINLS